MSAKNEKLRKLAKKFADRYHKLVGDNTTIEIVSSADDWRHVPLYGVQYRENMDSVTLTMPIETFDCNGYVKAYFNSTKKKSPDHILVLMKKRTASGEKND